MAKSNKPHAKSNYGQDEGLVNTRTELDRSDLSPERREWLEKMLLGTIPRYITGFIDRFCRRNLTVSETTDIAELLEALRANDLETMHWILEKSSTTVSQAPAKAAEAMRVVDSLRLERLRSRR